MNPIAKIKIISIQLSLLFVLIIFGSPAHAEYYLVYSTPCCTDHKTAWHKTTHFDYKGEATHRVIYRHKHRPIYHTHHHCYHSPCHAHRHCYSSPCHTHHHCYSSPCHTHHHCYSSPCHTHHHCSYYNNVSSCARTYRETCYDHRTYHPRYKVYTQRYTADDVDNPYYDYADGATGDDDPAVYPDMQITNPPY